MKTIIDEFTKLKVSRQRKYHLRHIRDGLCMDCSESSVDGYRCLKHAKANSERKHKQAGCKIRYKNTRLKRIIKSIPKLKPLWWCDSAVSVSAEGKIENGHHRIEALRKNRRTR